MARVAFFAVAAAMLGAASALEVVSPAEGSTVVADSSTYTVEWTGGGSGRFEIDLFYCGDSCQEGDCGEWVTALCEYGDGGCPDTAGNFDVVMPEPMDGTTSTGYKVRVMDTNDESNADCSSEFVLAASTAVDDGDSTRHITVTSPEDGDMAYAGQEYTVEFDYNNGFGSQIGRFSIDLYTASGNSDCGTWVTSVCDKPGVGCKDSMGDYDVTLPDSTSPGEYKIRVGLFEDSDLFGCSETFEVVDEGQGPDESEFSFNFEMLDGGDAEANWWEGDGAAFFP